MADIEQEFIIAICGSNKAESRSVDSASITPGMFSGYESEAQYVWKYREKYGFFPRISTLRKQFIDFPLIRTREPLRFYMDKFLERLQYRRLQKIMSEVNTHIKAKQFGGVQDALKAMASAQDLLQQSQHSSDVTWKQWNPLRNYRDRENQDGLFTTPYPSLNRMIRGVRNKNVVSLCARPAVGKTWLMVLFALHYWRQGARVLFVSKEMTAAEIYERMDAVEFQLPWIDFIEGKMKMGALQRLQKQRKKLVENSPLFIVTDSEDMGSSGLAAVDDKIVEHTPDVVMIDGAYLLDEATGRSFVEKATTVSRATKRLAKYRDVLIQQSLQMGRKAEEEGQDSSLAHIGWSDAYGQDSDVVLHMKGDKRESTRIVELLKGRTLAGGGMGEFYINALFEPTINLQEVLTGTSRTLKLSTVEG